MLLTGLKIKNFKSIASADIDFEPLTMLVGANASGKSNLINVFRFISNITTEGIDNAVALQGGIPYLANASLPKGTPIEISFTLDLSNEGWVRSTGKKTVALEIQKIDYHFTLQPNLRGGGYHIISDDMSLTFDCLHVDLTARRDQRYTSLNAKYLLSAENSKSFYTVKTYFYTARCY